MRPNKALRRKTFLLLPIAFLISSCSSTSASDDGYTPGTVVEDAPLTLQQNAKRTAESYLSSMAFSRSGLIEQLKFEGYPETEATLAVDSMMSVNWNEQAAKKGAEYLAMQGFSRSGLIDQLLFEGFTTEEANFGADANGL
jgi:hypothetical protein